MTDEVTQALDRNAVVRDSPLEKLVRENAYYIAGVDFANPSARAEKFDRFIAEQRRDPNYSLSFAQPQRKTKTTDDNPPINTLDLTPAQFKEIIDGKLLVEKAG